MELPDFDKLWNYREPEKTEAAFRELLPLAKEKGDENYYAELLTQLARTQSLQRKYDEAHTILDEVAAQRDNVDSKVKIRYLLERGRTFNSAGIKDKASSLFVQAFEWAKGEKEDFYAVDAAHMLGISEPTEKQTEWHLTAMKIAEASQDSRAKNWLGALYNNLGWTFHDLKQYDQALELFKKGVVWREERKDKMGTFIARWTVARCLRSLNRIEESLKGQLSLWAQMESGEAEADGFVYEELGELYLVKSETEKSKINFAKAYELLSKDKWMQANEQARLERMKSLGE